MKAVGPQFQKALTALHELWQTDPALAGRIASAARDSVSVMSFATEPTQQRALMNNIPWPDEEQIK